MATLSTSGSSRLSAKDKKSSAKELEEFTKALQQIWKGSKSDAADIKLLMRATDAVNTWKDLHEITPFSDRTLLPKQLLELKKVGWGVMEPFLSGGLRTIKYLTCDQALPQSPDTTCNLGRKIIKQLSTGNQPLEYEHGLACAMVERLDECFAKHLAPVMSYFAQMGSEIWRAAWSEYCVAITESVKHWTEETMTAGDYHILELAGDKLAFFLNGPGPFSPNLASGVPLLCPGFVHALEKIILELVPGLSLMGSEIWRAAWNEYCVAITESVKRWTEETMTPEDRHILELTGDKLTFFLNGPGPGPFASGVPLLCPGFVHALEKIILDLVPGLSLHQATMGVDWPMSTVEKVGKHIVNHRTAEEEFRELRCSLIALMLTRRSTVIHPADLTINTLLSTALPGVKKAEWTLSNSSRDELLGLAKQWATAAFNVAKADNPNTKKSEITLRMHQKCPATLRDAIDFQAAIIKALESGNIFPLESGNNTRQSQIRIIHSVFDEVVLNEIVRDPILSQDVPLLRLRRELRELVRSTAGLEDFEFWHEVSNDELDATAKAKAEDHDSTVNQADFTLQAGAQIRQLDTAFRQLGAALKKLGICGVPLVESNKKDRLGMHPDLAAPMAELFTAALHTQSEILANKPHNSEQDLLKKRAPFPSDVESFAELNLVFASADDVDAYLARSNKRPSSEASRHADDEPAKKKAKKNEYCVARSSKSVVRLGSFIQSGSSLEELAFLVSASPMLFIEAVGWPGLLFAFDDPTTIPK
ncbi:hypothetical protein B0H11DRAFT_2345482 [Mycena galericulata]|nr:hypothetical protein B0H11DRAFT_2345482 [Mycena galericulata]